MQLASFIWLSRRISSNVLSLGIISTQFFGLCDALPSFEEVQNSRLAFSRRDVLSYVVLGVMFHEMLESLQKTAWSSRFQYCFSGRIISWLGMIQTALINSYIDKYCTCCNMQTKHCSCEVLFQFQTKQWVIQQTQIHGYDGVRLLYEWVPEIRDMSLKQTVTIGRVWNVVYLLNSLKWNALKLHLCRSTCKWQQRFWVFLQAIWDLSPSQDTKQPAVIYGWISIYSKALYLGETKLGLFQRFVSHIRAFRTAHFKSRYDPKQKRLYLSMLNLGLGRFVYFPIYLWDKVVSRIERMIMESSLIWFKQPRLNTAGMRDVKLIRMDGQDKYEIPRRRRFRLVKRLVALERKRKGLAWVSPIQVTAQALRSEMLKYGEMFQMVSRLARRPLKMTAEFWTLAIVKRVCKLPRWRVARLMAIGTRVLSGASRNIFIKNFGMTIIRRTDVVFSRWTQTSPLFAVPRAKSILLSQLRSWQWAHAKRGVVIILRMSLHIGASASIIDLFESSSRWSLTPLDECTCACQLLRDEFPTYCVQDHILLPLSVYLAARCGSLPQDWSMRSRTVPQWQDLVKAFQVMATNLVARVSRKVNKREITLKVTSEGLQMLEDTRIQKAWFQFANKFQYHGLAQKLELVKSELKQFAVTPVDKYKPEGVVLCAKKYSEATLRLASSYSFVSQSQYKAAMDEVFKLGSKIPRLVFSNLRPCKEHRFGALRGWVKHKSLKKYPDSWESLKLRGLISYAQHFYRKSLSFLGRFTNYLTCRYQIGFHVNNPTEMVEAVGVFNSKRNETSKEYGGPLGLNWEIDDISEFFPSCSRPLVRAVFDRWCSRLKHDTGHRFFCISKDLSLVRLNPKLAQYRWRNREYRYVRKCFTTNHPTRNELYMPIDQMGLLVSVDYLSDYARLHGQIRRPSRGLNIGSPFAATAAALYVGDVEQRTINEMSDHERSLFDKHFLARRWQDDRIIFVYGVEQNPGLIAVFNKFRDRYFYGEGLELEQIRENNAFGFTFLDRQNQLSLLAAPRRNRSQCIEVPTIQNIPLAIMNRGQCFGPPSLIQTEALGACTRLLDLTNDSWEGIHMQIIRLLCEFRLQGIPLHVRHRCLLEMQRRCRVQLSADLRCILALSIDDCEVLSVGFDNLLYQSGLETVNDQQGFWARP